MVKIISAILVGNSTKATMADSRDSLKHRLKSDLRTTELSNNEVANLCESLCGKTVKELCAIVKSVCVSLTGSSRKTDITDRLIAMARIGAVKVKRYVVIRGKVLQR